MPRRSPLRDELLRVMEPGEWISGESLALRFGVSRAAIARHVAALRRDGSIIDAMPRRGYRLVSAADPWAGDDLPRVLRTLWLGKQRWLWLADTDSTNLALLRDALEGAPSGMVAVARHQRAGRGSRDRSWTDMPGCLMCSVLLRPPLRLQGTRDFLEAALESCRCALQSVCGADAAIKLPNDILLNSRKIGGVLVESILRNGELSCAVLGIGLNVNVPGSDIPESLRGKASSVYAETGRPASISALLKAILEGLEARIDRS